MPFFFLLFYSYFLSLASLFFFFFHFHANKFSLCISCAFPFQNWYMCCRVWWCFHPPRIHFWNVFMSTLRLHLKVSSRKESCLGMRLQVFGVWIWALVHRQRITKWGKLPFEPVAIPIRLLRLFLTELFCGRWADDDNVLTPRRTSLVSRLTEPSRSFGPDVGGEERRLSRALGGSAAPPRGRRSRSGLAGAAPCARWPLHRRGAGARRATPMCLGMVLASALFCCAALLGPRGRVGESSLPIQSF